MDIKCFFESPPVSYVHIKRATVLPSQTGKFVPVTISKMPRPDGVIIVHGCLGEILIPRAIIKTRRGNAWVWIVNLANKDVKIRAGCVFTSVEVGTDVSSNQICTAEVNNKQS